MARTSLFRKLQQIVAISAGPARHGRDTDDALTRRALLQRGAFAGATMATAGSSLLMPKVARAGSRSARIAVVGAGISGMSAAMTLKDAGFSNVTVYEAAQWVGGRTWTNTTFWEPGQWSEWGGELIDSNHATVFSLCDRFGIKYYDMVANLPPGASDILFFGGGYYPWSQMVQDWQASGADKVLDRMVKTLPPWPWPWNATWSTAAAAIDDMSVAQWINNFIPGGQSSRLGSFIDVAYNIEYGDETSRLGASCLLSLLGFPTSGAASKFWIYGASDERYKIRGGNQQIALAQADYLGTSNIRLGWRMTALQRASDGTVTLSFDVGGGKAQVVTADQVVLAIPLGVLKRIKGAGGLAYAGFDARKLAMIDALGMGANNKLQLQIADRFWIGTGPWPGVSDGESYADTGYQEAWHVTNGQPGSTGIIVDYTGGDVARQLGTMPKPFADTSDSNPAVRNAVAAAARTFLKQIEPVFPGMTSRWMQKATLSVWSLSPNQYGSYSYWPPGYLRRYCGYERVPMGAVHFAGEHCSQDFQGYIEGGAVEGIRAANEIVAAYP